ncbi:hypothetical protein HHK36_028122 [Tetracentron sinense]|uniref:RNase H type-1 domain-containing protein n=1 Tax=Tetracentron sinense TaxID=13715 RepID=A0A834YEC2_TETSI|nr:hypothetical protein HHK36_028122 [Tetracentron sinense]
MVPAVQMRKRDLTGGVKMKGCLARSTAVPTTLVVVRSMEEGIHTTTLVLLWGHLEGCWELVEVLPKSQESSPLIDPSCLQVRFPSSHPVFVCMLTTLIMRIGGLITSVFMEKLVSWETVSYRLEMAKARADEREEGRKKRTCRSDTCYLEIPSSHASTENESIPELENCHLLVCKCFGSLQTENGYLLILMDLGGWIWEVMDALVVTRREPPLWAIAGGRQVGAVITMELLALRCGLKEAVQQGCRKSRMESDSKWAVSCIKQDCMWPWRRNACLCAICDIIEGLDCFEIHHVPRETNRPADFLSKMCKQVEDIRPDPDHFPIFLSSSR